MKPEAQLNAIANACGWEYTFGIHSDNGMPWKAKDGSYHKSPPNYLNSLDAMHEAEKVLTAIQCVQYRNRLSELDTLVCKHWMLIHATAAQRAEAFLRTLNLWKDEP